MAGHNIPKGVSLDTLHEILIGWSDAGAANEPQYTADVEALTSVSDAVGRQTQFLEELGVLAPHKQQHELTDAGQELASALADSDEDRASAEARALLSDWDLTAHVRGILADNPLEQAALVPLVAELAEQDLDTSRVETGLTTLLDLYDWAGVLDRDTEGRYYPSENAGETESVDELAASTAREVAAETAEEVAETVAQEVADETAAATARDVVAETVATADQSAPATAETAVSGGDATDVPTEAAMGLAEEAEQALFEAADGSSDDAADATEAVTSERSDGIGELAVTAGGESDVEIMVDEPSGVEISVDGDFDISNADLPEGVHIESGGQTAGPSGADNLEPDGGVADAVDEKTDVELTREDGSLRINLD